VLVMGTAIGLPIAERTYKKGLLLHRRSGPNPGGSSPLDGPLTALSVCRVTSASRAITIDRWRSQLAGQGSILIEAPDLLPGAELQNNVRVPE